jgi:hypothetical protein
MKRKLRSLGLLFALSLACVGGALWMNKQVKEGNLTPTDDLDKKREIGRLLKIKADEVSKVRIETQEGPIVVAKKGDRWEILEPFPCAADSEKIKSYVDSLITQRASHIIEAEKATDLSQFGLKKPQNKLQIWTTDGQEWTLLVGGEGPSDDRYVQIEGRKELYMFSSWWVKSNILEKKLADFRDRTLLAFEKDDVTRLELIHGSTKIVCSKKEEQWQMEEPLKFKADKTNIDTLLTAVKDLKIDDFVEEEPKDLAKYGLHQPQAKILLTAKGQSLGLLIGKKSSKDSSSTTSTSYGGKLYAQVQGKKPVYLVSDSILEKLRKEPKDLRDKTVLALDTDRVNRVAYRIDGVDIEFSKLPPPEKPKSEPQKGKEETSSLEQPEAEWQLEKPQRLKADAENVKNLLSDLKNLTAREFIDQPADLAQYQLKVPRATVTVWEEGKPKPRILLIGKNSSKDTTAAYVKVQGEPTVYLVSNWFIQERLKTDLNQLRDLRLLTFKRENLQSFTLRFEKKPAATSAGSTAGQAKKMEVVVQRKGEFDWEVTKPERAEAESFKVGDVLYRLENLRGDEFVTDRPTGNQLREWGFDKPQVEVELHFKDRSRQTVLVGKQKEGTAKVYVKLKDGNVVVLKDSFFVTDLQKEPQDFKPSPPSTSDLGGMPSS